MRVGAVTHRGYGQLVLERFGPTVGLVQRRRPDPHEPRHADRRVRRDPHRPLVSSTSAPASPPCSASRSWSVTISGGRYRRWERVVLGMAIFNGLFLLAAIMVRPALGRGRPLAPDRLAVPRRKPQHAAAARRIDDRRDRHAVDDLLPAERVRRQGHDHRRISRTGRYDTIAGGAMAAIFGCGALIAGAALFGHGGASIAGLAGAAFPAALRHVSGSAVATVFALGLIEAGAVAMLTISASTGYAVGECIGAPAQLQRLRAAVDRCSTARTSARRRSPPRSS